MKRIKTALFLIVLLSGVLSEPRADTNVEDRVVVKPEITGEALINPGMGWICFYYSNRLWAYGTLEEPGDTLDWFPGCSTVYFRLPWCLLEPEEGKFRWDLIDSLANPWIEKGRKIALRITASENRYVYATPEWVKNAGAKGVFYTYPQKSAGSDASSAEELKKRPQLWDPKFDDPVFLEKLDHFLEAMAKRYNGNPDVAFIDIGSFGLWGEGHTGFSSKLSKEDTERIVKKHIDLYTKHFPDTLLAVSDDVVSSQKPNESFPATDYAFSKGVTLRDDSILVQKSPKHWHHSKMAQKFWPTLPVIIEHEHYDLTLPRGTWDKELLLRSVEEYHASYMSIHGWPKPYYQDNHDIIDRINRRLGYRLELREISYPKTIALDTPFDVAMKWANAGVAPCLPNGYVTVTLKNQEGNIVWSGTDERFQVKTLPVAEPGKAPEIPVTATLRCGIVTPIPVMNDGVIVQLKRFGKYPPFSENVPTVKPGVYSLYISVGRMDGKPVIALPLKENDGARRYKIGEITVVPQ